MLGQPGNQASVWQVAAKGLMRHQLRLKMPHVNGLNGTMAAPLRFDIAVLGTHHVEALARIRWAWVAGQVLNLAFAGLARSGVVGESSVVSRWVELPTRLHDCNAVAPVKTAEFAGGLAAPHEWRGSVPPSLTHNAAPAFQHLP